jgi:hypothetical protein
MTSPFVTLLALSIASAMGPGQILFDTLLLRSDDRGTLKAGLVVGGMTTCRLVQGIVFGFIFTDAVISIPRNGQHSTITSTLLLVLGVLLLISAYKQWQQGEDPDAPPPKWLAMIASLIKVTTGLLNRGL